jgi:hypothetical protein
MAAWCSSVQHTRRVAPDVATCPACLPKGWLRAHQQALLGQRRIWGADAQVGSVVWHCTWLTTSVGCQPASTCLRAPAQGTVFDVQPLSISASLACCLCPVPPSAPSRQLEQPYQREASHPLALEQQPYALRPWEAVKLACSRQLALRLGDKTMIKGRAAQVGGLAGGTRQLIAARDSQLALRCRPSPMPDWARWLPWHDCGCWQPGVADGSR